MADNENNEPTTSDVYGSEPMDWNDEAKIELGELLHDVMRDDAPSLEEIQARQPAELAHAHEWASVEVMRRDFPRMNARLPRVVKPEWLTREGEMDPDRPAEIWRENDPATHAERRRQRARKPTAGRCKARLGSDGKFHHDGVPLDADGEPNPKPGKRYDEPCDAGACAVCPRNAKHVFDWWEAEKKRLGGGVR